MTPDAGTHSCEPESPYDGYGEAVTYVEEHGDGTLWASNGEYGSQVNYCPVCGYRAKVAVIL